jgi:hypothetical protein
MNTAPAFRPGDRVLSNANDLAAAMKGARWVGVVLRVADLGGGIATLHTQGFWHTPGKAPRKATLRAVASDTVNLLPAA